jgi:protein-disulfide isomerase
MTYRGIQKSLTSASLSLGIVAMMASVAAGQLQFDRTPFVIPEHATIKGSPAAQYVVVEFSDYECPFCARHAAGSLANIETEFVDSGKVQYVVLNLPIEQIHPAAMKAAQAAECAGRVGKFWDMHDLLFQNQQSLRSADFAEYAKLLKLDGKLFAQCLAGSETARAIRADAQLAARMGVQGTPTFVFGEIKGRTVYPLQKFSGAAPFPIFQSAFEDLFSGEMRAMVEEEARRDSAKLMTR